MISITFEDRGNELFLSIKGHAGYAEHGKDIICASVSILTYTLASILESLEEAKSVIDLTSGDTIIKCECKDRKTSCKTARAYQYALTGYELLAHAYPKYVSLNICSAKT